MILNSLITSALPAPASRIFEVALCRRYYNSHGPDKFPPGSNVPETFCKIEDIQIAVVSTISTITVTTTLAELVVQIPMGVLADQKGRRLALALNITGILCYWSWVALSGLCSDLFPFWSVHFTPLFFLIGGGPRVTSALLFATLADVVVPEKRTAYFSYIEAAGYIADMVSPAIGSFLMSFHLAIPFITLIACYALSYVPVLFIAEAQPRSTPEHPETFEGAEDELLLGDNIETEGDSDNDEPAKDVNKGHGFFKHSFARVYLHLLETWRMVANDKNIILSLAVFFLLVASRSSANLLLQYVSKRYAWTIAQAGYLFSLKGAISALLFLVLIPRISIVMIKHTALEPHQISLIIAQMSIFVLALGSAIIGFAPNIWVLIFGFVILALGSGAGITLKSFLSATISNGYYARLYSVLGIAESLGILLGMPLLAETYSWGLKHGSWALGTPYLVCAILYTLVSMVVCCFKCQHGSLFLLMVRMLHNRSGSSY